MSSPSERVYEFKMGFLGILFLGICCTMAGTLMYLLLTGQIEGTTERPILGASIVSAIAVVMGVSMAPSSATEFDGLLR